MRAVLSVSRTLSLTLLCLAVGCDSPSGTPPKTVANAGKDGKAFDTEPEAETKTAAPAALATKDKPTKPRGKQVPPPADVAAPPADAKKTASGLAYKILEPAPADAKDTVGANDSVKVEYTGWTTDGKMFDSSVARGKTISFPLNGVIKGWTEGVQLMKVGDKFRFWIPAGMAYGENPGGGRPGGMLVFDVELFNIS